MGWLLVQVPGIRTNVHEVFRYDTFEIKVLLHDLNFLYNISLSVTPDDNFPDEDFRDYIIASYAIDKIKELHKKSQRSKNVIILNRVYIILHFNICNYLVFDNILAFYSQYRI